jgi:uncharacterized DUF497 family protein
VKISGFDWDDGNWPKCAKHGLTKLEVEQVIAGGPMVQADPKSPQDEARFNAVGKTSAGRHVFIVFTLRRRGAATLLRPISARFMHEKEVRHYERQRQA